MRVYLDNAASTKPLAQAVSKANAINEGIWGNPSSLHISGMEAEAEITESAEVIAGFCGCSADEVFFNSGGTEGDNTAVFGAANAHYRRGKHIITTVAEHPAVSQPMKALIERGYDVTFLSVDKAGHIDINELEASVRGDTILVSIHHVNSETGTIQDIMTAAKVVKLKNPDTVFHSDGVQAFGKLALNLNEIDLYTVSAHKLHAFKGTGALIVKKGVRISPLLYGGGQQRGLRSGTENVPGIAAFAVSANELAKNIESNRKHVLALKKHLSDIKEDLPNIFINGDEENGSPYILNMSFIGVRSEVLLHAMENAGIYISAGSACSSKKRKSGIPAEYGIGRAGAESAVRFSFSPFNNLEEIEYCKNALKQIVPTLRNLTN